MEYPVHNALKQYEIRIIDAVRKSPLSVTVTSAIDHRYIEVNEAFERITGWSRSEVLGRTPFDIGLWIDPGQRIDFVQRLLSGDTVHNLRFQARMKTGELRRALGSATLMELEGETCIVSLAADITDISRADEAISSPIMIWMCGADKVCTYFNQSWMDFTGRTLAQEKEDGWTRNIHPEDQKGYAGISEEAFKNRQSFQTQFRLKRYDGDYRWVLLSAMPRSHRNHSFAGYIGAALDVTERKQADALLSKATQTLIQSQEEERSRLSRELLGYAEQLTLLSIDIDRFEEGPPLSVPEFRQKIGEARQKIEDLIFEIQNLSQSLYSSKLRYLGLEAAARHFCAEFSQRSSVTIDFESEQIPESLPQQVSVCLFRVLQELLLYLARHQSSGTIRILLKNASDQLQLILHAGVSLDPGTLKSSGLGLIISNERLKMVQGELLIEIQDGGTAFRASVPLKKDSGQTQADAPAQPQ
jgi:PAS domain S-box-containing protein